MFVVIWHYLELTKYFVSVIANIPASVKVAMTQVNYYVRIKLISQLIEAFQEFSKNYSRILMVLLFQRLLYYHNQRFFLLFLP